MNACFLCGLALAAVTTAAPAEPIVTYDLTWIRALDLSKEAARHDLWDTCHLVAALQGLANREAPRLYVYCVAPWDRYWLRWLRGPGNWLSQRDITEIRSFRKPNVYDGKGIRYRDEQVIQKAGKLGGPGAAV